MVQTGEDSSMNGIFLVKKNTVSSEYDALSMKGLGGGL